VGEQAYSNIPSACEGPVIVRSVCSVEIKMSDFARRDIKKGVPYLITAKLLR